MSHQIKLSNFAGYVMEHQIAGAFGQGEQKEIRITVNTELNQVSYVIFDHGTKAATAYSLEHAIELYNKL